MTAETVPDATAPPLAAIEPKMPNGAVVCGLLLRRRIPHPSPGANPVLAHHWSLGWPWPRAAIDFRHRTQQPR
jgi:hypothetical protein